jgi:hypothetical protein
VLQPPIELLREMKPTKADHLRMKQKLSELREYVVEFRRLIELHDRTPARWQYFQHNWLWLYARGMIAGESPKLVKERRLAELEAERTSAKKEETAAPEAFYGAVPSEIKREVRARLEPAQI